MLSDLGSLWNPRPKTECEGVIYASTQAGVLLFCCAGLKNCRGDCRQKVVHFSVFFESLRGLLKDELQPCLGDGCVPRVAVSIVVATAAAVTSATIFIGVEGVAARCSPRLSQPNMGNLCISAQYQLLVCYDNVWS